jgi:hypothetical protein
MRVEERRLQSILGLAARAELAQAVPQDSIPMLLEQPTSLGRSIIVLSRRRVLTSSYGHAPSTVSLCLFVER